MGKDESSPSNRYRYLPLLSLLLAILSAGLVLRLYVRLPSDTYEKRVNAFGAALRSITENYAGKVEEKTLYEAAMRGMVGTLDDPYSSYLTGFELETAGAQTEGEFGGIGVVVSQRDGQAMVIEVQEGGPAAEAGLQPGDAIVGVNGRPVSEMSFVEMVSRIRGKVGTSVEVQIQEAETDKESTVAITRKLITAENVSWRYVSEGIGYIEVDQFDAHSLENVRGAIQELQSEGALRALILDVRGNVGGLLEAATGICDLFLSEGPIATVVSRRPDKKQVFRARGKTAVAQSLPLVVLTDARSASASEVTAGALQNLGRATIVGTTTFGKGAVNRIFVLPDKTGLFLTVAYYKVGKGQEIEGRGVEPDIVVGKVGPPPENAGPEARKQWLESYRKAGEKQLNRAIEYLQKRIEDR